VPADFLRTFFGVLEVLRPTFTPAAFPVFLTLIVGWLRAPGRRTLGAVLVAANVAGTQDHTAFYRFFARGTWHPDTLGRAVFGAVLAVLTPGSPVGLVLDDTLARHKGPHVFGLGTHLDAVRSTRTTKVFAFGHVWVVLAVVVPVPWSHRSFALPVLFRLYRTAAECLRAGVPHQPKTVLAREMLDVLTGWLAALDAGRPLLLAIDNGYTNRTVLGGVPAHVAVVGAMRPDAALHVAGTSRSPAALAADTTQPWQELTAWLYGRRRTVRYKVLVATWPRVCGDVALRVVVVQCVTGSLPLRVFCCTEATASARAVLEFYAAGRWPIECTFRDLKQGLGFADAGLRLETAVRRLAPFVGLLYSLLVLWSVRAGLTPTTAVVPARRWYRQKRMLSFADVLTSAQKILATGDLHALDAAARATAAATHQPLPHARPRLKRAA
jgi:hypothetical protein